MPIRQATTAAAVPRPRESLNEGAALSPHTARTPHRKASALSGRVATLPGMKEVSARKGVNQPNSTRVAMLATADAMPRAQAVGFQEPRTLIGGIPLPLQAADLRVVS